MNLLSLNGDFNATHIAFNGLNWKVSLFVNHCFFYVLFNFKKGQNSNSLFNECLKLVWTLLEFNHKQNSQKP